MFNRIKQLSLILGDLLALNLSLCAALWLRYFAWPAEQWAVLFYPMAGLFAVAVVIFFIVGLYDVGQAKNNLKFFQKIGLAMGIWLVFGLVFFYLNHRIAAQPKTIIALCALIGIGLVSAWRAFHNKFLSKSILKTNIVFVGLTQEVFELIAKIEHEPALGYEIVGLIRTSHDTCQEQLPGLSEYATAGSLSELTAKQSKPAQIYIIAPQAAQDENLSKELYARLFEHSGAIFLAKFYEDILNRIPPFIFSETWFLANLDEQRKKIYDRARIIVDFIFAGIMAVIFAVTFPLVAIVIKISSRGPIFFVQERVGRNGKIFKIIKYRTMKALSADGSAETGGAQYASVNDARITSVGNFLRKSRIDELPQFINIFKSEMALIGPRPERPEFVAELSAKMPYYSLRHLIKPGMTGWAQIQKSYYGTIEENLRKLEFDLYYLKNRGAILDTAIILRTFNILGRMAGR
jgi:exopolysaccharide biosynthesis polyprenyl glycosylphosphotransferase